MGSTRVIFMIEGRLIVSGQVAPAERPSVSPTSMFAPNPGLLLELAPDSLGAAVFAVLGTATERIRPLPDGRRRRGRLSTTGAAAAEVISEPNRVTTYVPLRRSVSSSNNPSLCASS